MIGAMPTMVVRILIDVGIATGRSNVVVVSNISRRIFQMIGAVVANAIIIVTPGTIIHDMMVSGVAVIVIHS